MSTNTIPGQRADARDRAARTFWTGLGLDVALALAAALLLWLPDADLTRREAWIAAAVALAKTGLGAAASYVLRLRVPPADYEPTGYAYDYADDPEAADPDSPVLTVQVADDVDGAEIARALAADNVRPSRGRSRDA